MATASQVAEYFIRRGVEVDDMIGGLKLQKLLYYAQGFHLAIEGEPLFKDRIKAWRHGPVVPGVWQKYRHVTPQPDYDLRLKFSKDQLELLDEVWNVYGCYSGWMLRNMTHEEPPWLETERDEEIKPKAMKAYFKTRVE